VRRRIVLVAGAATLTVAAAFVVPLAGLVAQLASDRAISAAETDADVVARVVGTSENPERLFSAVVGQGLLNNRPTSLIRPDGTVLGAPPGLDENIPAAQAGVARARVEAGQVVYTPVVTDEGTLVVRVLIPNDQLNEGVLGSWLVLGLLGIGLVGLGVLAADRMARSIVRPVISLARAATELGKGDLGTRVTPDGPPEIVAVGVRFNELAGRIGTMLELERRNTADLSHRLRTPLTAMRLDIDQVDREEDRERLRSSLDELERTVTHIIDESKRGMRSPARSDIVTVVEERLDFWRPLADEEGRAVSVELLEKPIFVPVGKSDLVAAFDALIENVHAHTPTDTPYMVSMIATTGIVTVTISDKGPGFSSKEVEKRGVSTSGSTGLGLDIARRTAEAAGGRLTVSFTPGGGASVHVALPIIG
jgi:signal transduction histidine kinase